MDLKGKVAIVTGGGRNIGRAIAYRLSEMGIHVVVCARTQKEIDHTAAVIQEQGGRSIPIHCDVSNEEDVMRVIDNTLKFFGQIDFLVNNAGNFVSKPLLETSNDDFETTVNANLRGAFLFSKAVIPHLKKAESGRIVNVSSLLGIIPSSDVAVYCMAKAGLIGFSKALSRELHAFGVNVNAICPGEVTTAEDEVIELQDTRRVLGNHLLPRDVADAVAYLLTDQSSQITGAAVEIPGQTGFKVGAITSRL